MTKRLSALFLCLFLLTGCNGTIADTSKNSRPITDYPPNTQGTAATLGDDNTSFGEEIEDSGIYDGLFDEITQTIAVEWVSGSKNAYTIEGSTITFTAVTEDTVYQISGEFQGNIVIDIADENKLELELCGFSLVSKETNPICILSGDKVTIQAKKDTKNYIYDLRPAAEATAYAGAIHSEADLEISGKGALSVVSENNNGIHSKDDLKIKNLTLSVACLDNALKGNDSVTVENATTKLIASVGDCIKTTNSDISEKGNQRGDIAILGGSHALYAACDGIDAAHDVVIQEETTTLSIYTDKYSNYSKEVIANSASSFYIRYTSQRYTYSVKYIHSETGAFEWVDATYHSQVSGGRTTYYYYAFPKKDGYDKLQFFVYSSDMPQQQETEYAAASEVMTISTSYDTIALTSSSYSWTNYTTSIQGGGFGGPGGPGGGPGGMMDGNTDKGNHSTKGIKAANRIVIADGILSIKSYDDAIHAGSDTALGNVTIQGGNLTLYSNDDGIHADVLLSIQGGTVTVTNAYEGLEGTQVEISGGYISVHSKDDGINATTSSGTAISISGGTIYIYCTGDGIDSNSRTANVGIVFTGGNTVVISNSSMNSALDTENGYTYTAGSVIAIMPRGGMSGEATHCSNFNSIGKSAQLSLTGGSYLVVGIGSQRSTIQMPVSLSAIVVVLGDKAATVKTESSTDVTLDANGVAWQ